jgi:hypothetical protein
LDQKRTGDLSTIYERFAKRAYARWLPLINYEKRQTGLAAAKILMEAGGVIQSATLRHPLDLPHPATQAELIELACDLDAIVLRWGARSGIWPGVSTRLDGLSSSSSLCDGC